MKASNLNLRYSNLLMHYPSEGIVSYIYAIPEKAFSNDTILSSRNQEWVSARERAWWWIHCWRGRGPPTWRFLKIAIIHLPPNIILLPPPTPIQILKKAGKSFKASSPPTKSCYTGCQKKTWCLPIYLIISYKICFNLFSFIPNLRREKTLLNSGVFIAL